MNFTSEVRCAASAFFPVLRPKSSFSDHFFPLLSACIDRDIATRVRIATNIVVVYQIEVMLSEQALPPSKRTAWGWGKTFVWIASSLSGRLILATMISFRLAWNFV